MIPGILVGHYTQLAWAQNHRIGCGKLFSYPEGSRYGQQFFICNYGIAGNLIKSEMYKVRSRLSVSSLHFHGLLTSIDWRGVQRLPSWHLVL